MTATAAGGTGSFVARITVPQAISGTHYVIAVGQPSGKSAFTSVQVRPQFVLAPTSGSAGSRIVTSGFGFGAGEQVRVFWDAPPQVLGSTTSGATGSFYGTTAVTATVPLSITTGVHTVYAVGQTSHTIGSAVFTVH
jgi:hypothetical protein